MKKILILTVAVAILAGCAGPAGTGKTGSAPGVLDLTKPGAVIKSLDIGKVDLPKSLQDGSTNTAAQDAKGRALGDVTTLTSLNLPSLKASGYQDFRRSVDKSSMAKMFLDGLKGHPEVANGTLAVGTTIDTGTLAMDIGYGTPIYLSNSGKLRTKLSDDGQTLWIYWTLSYPDGSKGSGGAKTPQEMFDSFPRIPINLYFIVSKTGSVEMYAYKAKDAVSGVFMNYWTRYDSNTKASVEVQESLWGGPTPSTMLSQVTPQVGGGFSIYRKDTGSYNHETLGFADDQFGGVVSEGVSTYDDGSGTPTDHPYLNVEFYDGTGDLIYQGQGDTGSNSGNWSWRFHQGSDANLADVWGTRPTRFTMVETWKAGTQTRQVSLDGTTDWKDLPSGWGGLVYHDTAHDVAGTWTLQPGDASYWIDTSSYSYDPVSGIWTGTYTYYKGYEVPAGEAYFGKTYFVNKTYPLKNLLPLKAQYAVGYEVRQKEGTTWWNWSDLNGNWQSGTTEPAAGTYEPGRIYHYTSFDYWLENKAYLNAEGTDDNSDETQDWAKGDVSLSLQEMSVYSWNMALGESVRSSTAAFETYQSDLPPYFSLDADKVKAVASTQAKLEALYAQRDTLTIAGYLEGYAEKIGAVLDQFPSLDGYPAVP